MAGARALLPVILVSVCLIVIFVIPHATAIEKPESDPTRPSESIETEEETVQVDELGGNQSGQPNTPAGGKPDIETHEQDLSYNKIKVKFEEVVLYGNSELGGDCPGACTDAHGSEWNLIAYVQGKKIDVSPIKNAGHGGFNINKEITVSIPKTDPLSIMFVGYEEDGCRHYEYPDDIQQAVTDALSVPGSGISLIGKYPKLETIVQNLGNDINGHCVQDQNHHDIANGISEVYEPISGDIHYGEGTHTETSMWKYAPTFYAYKIKFTISQPILVPEIENGK